MAVTDKKVIRVLNGLHRYCVAGEKGFEVVAENARNRGLKMQLKTYARQRAEFASELEVEIKRLGGEVSKRESIRGLIHRGRIAIVSSLIIGDHNVENHILGEALLGEAVVVNAYKKAVGMALPEETKALVQRQYEALMTAHDHIELLRGRSGERLVVRLFDSQEDTQAAINALTEARFSKETMERVPVGDFFNTYSGSGTTLLETVLSGALGGAIWGSMIGAIGGLVTPVIPGMESVFGSSFQTAWAVFALGGTAVGALVAGLLGFLIGLGISEEDIYLYDDSLRHGVELLRLQTDSARSLEATQIMHQINAAARAKELTRTAQQAA
ncbi:MAG: PA2169 family four-helix-bundle protein [Candidatus Promineifilaceae bacterium]